MTELTILVAILVGALLFGGGIVAGVWLARAVEHGFPKIPAPRPTAPPVPQVPLPPQYEPPPEPPSYRPPPATPKQVESPYRYGGQTELESSRNFELLQARLAAQQAGGPFTEAYDT